MTFASVVTEMEVTVSPDDLGTMGYIEDSAYLRWVQHVVVRHWERFAPASARASTLWIAVRHQVSLRSPGLAELGLIARTRISRLKGVRAVFTTEFRRGSTLLAEVESTWVALDAATKQPKALESSVVDAFRHVER